MARNEDPLDNFREAVRLSPENVLFRRCLVDLLRTRGLLDEAVNVYREGLALAPRDESLKLGLAGVYHELGKNSAALVIVEDLLKERDTPAEAYLLHARLLWEEGNVERAVSQYQAAVDSDPDVSDADFAEHLGIGEDESSAEVVDGKLRAGWEPPTPEPATPVERPTVNFRDVGGMDVLKEEIGLKIIYPMQHPEIYEAYGKKTGGGILMYGPPGCGKTHLARATAGEIHAAFISVGINDVLDMWIGNSERNLHELFEQARRSAPCVLFFDEVDALGARRSDMQHSAGRHLINQFLSEMDGITSANDGILVLAATNAPWHLDPAFRRPGRFDRILFVPPPDAPARESILQILCLGKPVEKIDYKQVAKKTADFSGADLKAVLDVAIEQKLRKAFKDGKPSALVTADLLAAAATLKPTTQEWFSTAKNYALYSNQGGTYDDILKHLKLK